MTKQEKISELINIRDNFNYTLASREVFDDAIKALEDSDNEYKRFAEFVVSTCTSFVKSNEDKAKDIIDELINHKKKYPKLSLLWDQYCGIFS